MTLPNEIAHRISLESPVAGTRPGSVIATSSAVAALLVARPGKIGVDALPWPVPASEVAVIAAPNDVPRSVKVFAWPGVWREIGHYSGLGKASPVAADRPSVEILPTVATVEDAPRQGPRPEVPADNPPPFEASKALTMRAEAEPHVLPAASDGVEETARPSTATPPDAEARASMALPMEADGSHQQLPPLQRLVLAAQGADIAKTAQPPQTPKATPPSTPTAASVVASAPVDLAASNVLAVPSLPPASARLPTDSPPPTPAADLPKLSLLDLPAAPPQQMALSGFVRDQLLTAVGAIVHLPAGPPDLRPIPLPRRKSAAASATGSLAAPRPPSERESQISSAHDASPPGIANTSVAHAIPALPRRKPAWMLKAGQVKERELRRAREQSAAAEKPRQPARRKPQAEAPAAAPEAVEVPSGERPFFGLQRSAP